MIDPLTQKYLEVLTEGKNNNGTVKGEKNKPGKSFEGTEKLNKEKNTSTKNAKIQKPTEDKRNSTSSRDGKMENCKKVVTDSINSFEDLYNKVLKEDDSFGWSMQDDTENEDEGDETSTDSEYEFDSGEMDEEGEMGDEEEMGDEGEEVTLTLDKETAQKLIDILQAAVGGGEESEEEGEEESEEEGEEDLFSGVSDEDEDEEEDETLTKEEVDAEIVGHSLVDQEKLLKGMNKPSNGVVKGAISAKKKKAQVPLTGKGFKGELSPQGDKSKVLQGKNNKVPAVNAGNKSFFDNK
jgi:hypothetical protein